MLHQIVFFAGLLIFSIELAPTTANDSVEICPRIEWGAEPPQNELTLFPQTPSYVVISHTAAEPCFSKSECIQRTRIIQKFHTEDRKWDDIGYNFVIGGDGVVYEGRGWNKVGAHTFGFNDKSIGISFIGTFNNVEPTSKQVDAALKLINKGVSLGKIADNYKLLGHRQFTETLSPGEKLYAIIKQWPHWTVKP